MQPFKELILKTIQQQRQSTPISVTEASHFQSARSYYGLALYSELYKAKQALCDCVRGDVCDPFMLGTLTLSLSPYAAPSISTALY